MRKYTKEARTGTPEGASVEQLRARPDLAYRRQVWASTQANEREATIKQRLRSTPMELDVERARYATASYRQTEGEPMPIRRAKMLLHLVRNLSIAIDQDELIVGNRSLLPRMGVIAPEGAVDWVARELEALPTRPQDRFQVTTEKVDELRRHIFPYWRGKTLEDLVAARLEPDVRQAVQGRVFSLNQTDHAQGHILPDVEAWLRLGVGDLRKRVETARGRDSAQCVEKQVFYDAASISLLAAEEFITRYAELAARLAAHTDSSQRREELSLISRMCKRIALQAPRTFWEALQSVWFLFVLLQIESNASSFSPGRFDQYMLPYLEADLENGAITLPEAQGLLEQLWLKFNQIVLLRSSTSARYFAGFPIGFNIILGGQHPNGTDATNFLSYMALRAQANLGLTQPNLSIRVHQDSPEEFLLAASSVVSRGGGMPQMFNDEVIIPALLSRNVALEDAINYAVVGCVELSVPGKSLGWSDASMFNLTRLLELTLFGGRDPQSGQLIGLDTEPLDRLQHFEDLEAMFDSQLTHFVGLMVKGCNLVDTLHSELLPSPFLSLSVWDCIERGTDVTAGGARYNFSGVQGVQIANLADSLIAVKHAIFDDRWVEPATLLDALRSNFQGYEDIRQRLIHRVPKYGNDVDEVDQIGRKWAQRYCEVVTSYPSVRGGTYQPGFYTVSAHIPMGTSVGATPDGRFAGTPLADGGVSPMTGRDLRGPTAVLLSVAKINLRLASNGTLLNIKFLPSFFDEHEALEKFVGFIRGFIDLEIPHVQFNVVSAAELRAAQANPDKYRYLAVRVAGYSAYFVDLDPELQEEIIHRTEFGAV